MYGTDRKWGSGLETVTFETQTFPRFEAQIRCQIRTQLNELMRLHMGGSVWIDELEVLVEPERLLSMHGYGTDRGVHEAPPAPPVVSQHSQGVRATVA